MQNKYLGIFLSIIFFINTAFSQNNPPQVYSLDPSLLLHTKELIESQSPLVMPAYKQLIKDADKFLSKNIMTVMDKEKLPPSGDKHDYLSLSIYSWPNPDTKNGLPYITKDGQVNPESEKGTDAKAMVQMCESAFTQALAYFLSGNEKYSDRAADILRTWFIDSKTKMNPNLNYAQIVTGKNEGSPGGIIDSRNLINVTEAAGLLVGSTAWRDEDMNNLKLWFKDFTNWLETSENGITEGKTKNNHLTFYKAQVINYSLFSDNKDEALKQLETVKELINSQIEPDGSQPLEMKRTKSFNYSVFNLQAFFLLAEMGKNEGVDIYNYKTDKGASIRKALDYVAPYSDSLLDWKGREIGIRSGGIYWLAELLKIASVRYPDGKFSIIFKDNYGKVILTKQWNLLYPD